MQKFSKWPQIPALVQVREENATCIFCIFFAFSVLAKSFIFFFFLHLDATSAKERESQRVEICIVKTSLLPGGGAGRKTHQSPPLVDEPLVKKCFCVHATLRGGAPTAARASPPREATAQVAAAAPDGGLRPAGAAPGPP